MTSAAIATVVKMMETLPEDQQEQVAERIRTYIAEMLDEDAWDAQFGKTQPQLIAAAHLAKQQIAEGHSELMDENKL